MTNKLKRINELATKSLAVVETLIGDDYCFKADDPRIELQCLLQELRDEITRSIKKDSDVFYESCDDDIIEDGFGSVWSAWCYMCGRKSMQIVRPGKVQCGYCG